MRARRQEIFATEESGARKLPPVPKINSTFGSRLGAAEFTVLAPRQFSDVFSRLAQVVAECQT
eukprot:scaffold2771_cov252-Pinguiococcus_pyrenoidosus.AAC.16